MGPIYNQGYPLSLETVIQQRVPQLDYMKQYQQSPSVLEEINKITASFSDEEKIAILNSAEYKSAQATYESGFMAFLNNKFCLEFLNTPEGRIAGENLLKTISEKKDSVKKDIQERNAKLEKLAILLEQNPELKKQLESIK